VAFASAALPLVLVAFWSVVVGVVAAVWSVVLLVALLSVLALVAAV